MDLGSIFLVLALLVLVALFVARPFFDHTQPVSAEAEAQDLQLSALMAERDRVLAALQELDFDYSLGKIPEEDYPAQRSRLLQYGADVLRKIDAAEGASVSDVKAPTDTEATETLSAEDRIEATIAARRAYTGRGQTAPLPATNGGKVVPAAIAAPDDELEVLLANRRRNLQTQGAGFCPKCGSALYQNDKFCSKCGKKIV
jgi:hypothetical protein